MWSLLYVALSALFFMVDFFLGFIRVAQSPQAGYMSRFQRLIFGRQVLTRFFCAAGATRSHFYISRFQRWFAAGQGYASSLKMAPTVFKSFDVQCVLWRARVSRAAVCAACPAQRRFALQG